MDRPFVFINVAMTADGKIDTVERKGAAISSPRDRERVDRLRTESNAVMVGGRTLLDEDPKLTVKTEASGTMFELKTFNEAKAGMTMGWSGAFDRLEKLLGP